MKKTKSYNVQIWCGLKRGYIGQIQEISKAQTICEDFVDKKKECVTITQTTFVYVGSHEPGFIIGFIRYPRYINSKKEIRKRAIELGKLLMDELGQNRVTITTPKKSIMLENKKINQQIVKSKPKKK
jgi:hypothetical protein